jgi:hypothetical protein
MKQQLSYCAEDACHGVWDVSSDNRDEWSFNRVTRRKFKKDGRDDRELFETCMSNFAHKARKMMLDVCIDGGAEKDWRESSDNKFELAQRDEFIVVGETYSRKAKNRGVFEACLKNFDQRVIMRQLYYCAKGDKVVCGSCHRIKQLNGGHSTESLDGSLRRLAWKM